MSTYMVESWPSRTRKFRCPEGSVYWRICENPPGQPYFVEGHVGRAGGSEIYAAVNAIGMLAGRALRTGTDPHKLKMFLRGIAVCSQEEVDAGTYDALSAADALARTLEEFYS